MSHTIWVKTLSLILVLAALMEYQTVTLSRQKLTEERETAIAAVEEFNAAQTEAAQTKFADGQFEGSGEGFGGKITVLLTIKDGEITSVEITEAKDEDAAYLEQAEALLDKIVRKQSTDVDAVTGATYSSNGILAAASDALAKAVQ